MPIDNLETIKACQMFEAFGAPLCPIDANIKDRLWYTDESICTSRTYGAGIRWIAKQRSIKRRQTKSYMDRSITYEELFDNSKKKNLTDEQVKIMTERLLQNRPNKEMKGNAACA